MKTSLPQFRLVVAFLIALSSPGAQAQLAGPGSALSLDGATGYIQVTNGVWFSGNFTVEGWVFARGYSSWSRLFDFANGPNTNNVFLAVSWKS